MRIAVAGASGFVGRRLCPALEAAGHEGFDDRADAALRCARLVERDPLMVNASAHLLAVGRR